MLRKITHALILIYGVSFGVFPAFAGPPLEARSSDAGGVSIMVKPKPIEATATVWEFEVTMNTHTKPLAEDLAAVSVLVENNGNRIKPTEWLGDKPGGHHRKGILRFPVGSKTLSSFELQMADVGGVSLRTFRWESK